MYNETVLFVELVADMLANNLPDISAVSPDIIDRAEVFAHAIMMEASRVYDSLMCMRMYSCMAALCVARGQPQLGSQYLAQWTSLSRKFLPLPNYNMVLPRFTDDPLSNRCILDRMMSRGVHVSHHLGLKDATELMVLLIYLREPFREAPATVTKTNAQLRAMTWTARTFKKKFISETMHRLPIDSRNVDVTHRFGQEPSTMRNTALAAHIDAIQLQLQLMVERQLDDPNMRAELLREWTSIVVNATNAKPRCDDLRSVYLLRLDDWMYLSAPAVGVLERRRWD